MEISEQQLEAMMERVVKKTLLSIGIDITKPQEMQKDMICVRDWRESAAFMRKNVRLAALVTVVSGALGLLWLGFKFIISKGA